MTSINATNHLSNVARKTAADHDATPSEGPRQPDPRPPDSPTRRPGTMRIDGDVTIRYSRPDDAASLRDLAGLDSRRPLVGACLVAVVDGTILAARALGTGEAIAHPFHPTASLIELLRQRAGDLDGSRDRQPGRRGARAVFGSLAGRPHHLGARLS